MADIFPLTMQPGIQKDGTPFSTRNWTDGQWMRFRRALPQKIGGYKSLFVTDLGDSVPRGTITVPYDEQFYVYFGISSGLFCVVVDKEGNVLDGPTDLTPDDYVESDSVSWTFDLLFSTTSRNLMIIAHPGCNLIDINNREERPIYIGVADGSPLQELGQSVSGGILSLNPYLITLNNDGTIKISEANQPQTFLVERNRITAQKLIAGREMRGAGGTSGLIWSVDTLMRLTFVGGPSVFRADKVGKTSLISNNAIVEMDNIFFWVGSDRFYYYNGVINTLPNKNNIDYFYKNINKENQHKTWAAINPEFSEIWIFFPFGNSTECNHAIIWNKIENAWYNTEITRSCGYFDYVFNKPIWFTNEDNIGLVSYRHEIGKNKDYTDLNGERNIEAIQTYIKTSNISWCSVDAAGQWKGENRLIKINRFEPDFIQSGDIDLIVGTRSYARSDNIPYSYVITGNTFNVDIWKQGREITLLFNNEDIDGDIQFGNNLLDITFGDVRR